MMCREGAGGGCLQKNMCVEEGVSVDASASLVDACA